MPYTLAFMVLSVIIVGMAGAAGEFTISQRNRAFSVPQIAIQVGDQITFVNEDDVSHSVYSETVGAEFESSQRPGQFFARDFVQPGVVEVRCAIHPNMHLEVHVRQ
jgi:plastocyanin